MILTTKMLLEQLNDYSNPNNKIKRMVDKKELFTICKGLYEDNKNVSPKYLANAIYGPSYISFNSALSYYGLIPEKEKTVQEKMQTEYYTYENGKFVYTTTLNEDEYNGNIGSDIQALNTLYSTWLYYGNTNNDYYKKTANHCGKVVQ